jgi:hypothetical protein
VINELKCYGIDVLSEVPCSGKGKLEKESIMVWYFFGVSY